MRKLILVFLLSNSIALANIVGNDTQNFNPTPSGLDFITVQSSETLEPGITNLGLFFNFSRNSMPKVQDEIGEIIRSNDSTLFSDIGIGYGLRENVGIGLNISTIHSQETNRTVSGAQFAQTGLNEIRGSIKYNFFRRSNLGMAIGGSVNSNQVRNNPFIGKGAGPTRNVEWILDYDFSNFNFATNLGYRFRDKGSEIPGSYYKPLDDQYVASFGASYYDSKLHFKWISEIYTSRLVKEISAYKSERLSAEGLVGIKYNQNTNSALSLGIGMPLSKGLFNPDHRVFAGITHTFDSKFAVYPKKSTSVVQVTHQTLISKYGYQPEDIIKMKDVSFDELVKTHEFVLRTALDIDAYEKVKPPFEVVRLEGFDFYFGSSEIRSEYTQIFQEVVAYLNSTPAILKIRIEGHTDSIGSPDRNRMRSQKRAESVSAFLSKTGLNKNILVDSIGYGSDRPVADNGNFQGRKKNRRVEIRILRQIKPIVDQIEH